MRTQDLEVACPHGGFVRDNGYTDVCKWDFMYPSLSMPKPSHASVAYHSSLADLLGFAPLTREVVTKMNRLNTVLKASHPRDCTHIVAKRMSLPSGWTYLNADDFRGKFDQRRQTLGLVPVTWVLQNRRGKKKLPDPDNVHIDESWNDSSTPSTKGRKPGAKKRRVVDDDDSDYQDDDEQTEDDFEEEEEEEVEDGEYQEETKGPPQPPPPARYQHQHHQHHHQHHQHHGTQAMEEEYDQEAGDEDQPDEQEGDAEYGDEHGHDDDEGGDQEGGGDVEGDEEQEGGQEEVEEGGGATHLVEPTAGRLDMVPVMHTEDDHLPHALMQTPPAKGSHCKGSTEDCSDDELLHLTEVSFEHEPKSTVNDEWRLFWSAFTHIPPSLEKMWKTREQEFTSALQALRDEHKATLAELESLRSFKEHPHTRLSPGATMEEAQARLEDAGVEIQSLKTAHHLATQAAQELKHQVGQLQEELRTARAEAAAAARGGAARGGPAAVTDAGTDAGGTGIGDGSPEGGSHHVSPGSTVSKQKYKAVVRELKELRAAKETQDAVLADAQAALAAYQQQADCAQQAQLHQGLSMDGHIQALISSAVAVEAQKHAAEKEVLMQQLQESSAAVRQEVESWYQGQLDLQTRMKDDYISSLETTIASHKTDQCQHDSDVRQLQQQVQVADAARAAVEARCVSLHDELAHMTAQLREAQIAKDRSDSAKQALHERLLSVTKQLSERERELSSLQAELSSVQSELVAAQAEQQQLQQHVEGLNQQLSHKEVELGAVTMEREGAQGGSRVLQQDVERLQGDVQERDAALHELSRQRDCALVERQVLEDRVSALQSELQQKADQLATAVQERGVVGAASAALEEAHAALQADLAKVHAELYVVRGAAEEATAQLEQHAETLGQQLQERLAELQAVSEAKAAAEAAAEAAQQELHAATQAYHSLEAAKRKLEDQLARQAGELTTAAQQKEQLEQRLAQGVAQQQTQRKVEQQREGLEASRKQLEQQVTSLQAQLTAAESELAAAQQGVSAHLARISELDKKLGDTERELTGKGLELWELNETLSARDKEVQQLQQRLESKEAEMQQVQEQHAANKADEDQIIANIKQELINIKERAVKERDEGIKAAEAQCAAQVADMQRQVDAAVAESTGLQARLRVLQSAVEKGVAGGQEAALLQATRAELTVVKTQLHSAQGLLRDVEAANAQLKAQYAAKEKDFKSLQSQVDALKGQLDMLQQQATAANTVRAVAAVAAAVAGAGAAQDAAAQRVHASAGAGEQQQAQVQQHAAGGNGTGGVQPQSAAQHVRHHNNTQLAPPADANHPPPGPAQLPTSSAMPTDPRAKPHAEETAAAAAVREFMQQRIDPRHYHMDQQQQQQQQPPPEQQQQQYRQPAPRYPRQGGAPAGQQQPGMHEVVPYGGGPVDEQGQVLVVSNPSSALVVAHGQPGPGGGDVRDGGVPPPLSAVRGQPTPRTAAQQQHAGQLLALPAPDGTGMQPQGPGGGGGGGGGGGQQGQGRMPPPAGQGPHAVYMQRTPAAGQRMPQPQQQHPQHSQQAPGGPYGSGGEGRVVSPPTGAAQQQQMVMHRGDGGDGGRPSPKGPPEQLDHVGSGGGQRGGAPPGGAQVMYAQRHAGPAGPQQGREQTVGAEGMAGQPGYPPRGVVMTSRGPPLLVSLHCTGATSQAHSHPLCHAPPSYPHPPPGCLPTSTSTTPLCPTCLQYIPVAQQHGSTTGTAMVTPPSLIGHTPSQGGHMGLSQLNTYRTSRGTGTPLLISHLIT